MEWTYVALLQMFLIAAGVCGAFWLRIRNIKAQNDQLREFAEQAEQRIEEAKKTPTDLPKGPVAREWLKEQLEEVSEEDQTAPVQQAVIKHLIKNERKFDNKLLKTIEKNGLGGSGEGTSDDAGQAARIAELEAEIEQLKNAPAPEGTPDQDGPSQDDLRDLLQQFTHDTRDMMECINTLEQENAGLRAQLGLEPQGAAEPESKAEPQAEAEADARAEADTAPEADTALEPEPGPEPETDPEAEAGPETEPEAEAEAEAEASSDDHEEKGKEHAA